jgi:hypothetical protein
MNQETEEHNELDATHKFKWVSGADAQKIWRRYGWRPPSEYRTDYLFAQNREEAPKN